MALSDIGDEELLYSFPSKQVTMKNACVRLGA
jgi:hypothetical protein